MRKNKGRKVLDFLVLLLAVSLVVFGLLFALKPNIEEHEKAANRKQAISLYKENISASTVPEPSASGDSDRDGELPTCGKSPSLTNAEPVRWPELLAAAEEYNKELFLNGQSRLNDPWAYAETALDLSLYGYDGDVFGTVSVPKLDIELPIYLGATWQHMEDGAAQMTVTSIPIGGENTNSVLAIHRGYIMDVELIELGDRVVIENPWGTLDYEVVSIQIIYPHETEKVFISPGHDYVTLMTCHPWGSNGQYRYLVIAERVQYAEGKPEEPAFEMIGWEEVVGAIQNHSPENLVLSEGIEFVSSKRDIMIHRWLPVTGICAVVILALIVAVMSKSKGKQRKKNEISA